MSDLLERAVAAHGGLGRWQKAKAVTVHIAPGGGAFHVKGWANAYSDIHCSIDTRRPHTEFWPFLKSGQRCVYEPNQTAIVSDGGKLIEKQDAPRATF